MAAATNTQRDASRLMIGRKLGRYEILARLAAGGMAEVYVARAQGVAGFERLVALKVLHQNLAHEEEFIAMFLDEARLAARIRHPNVVPTLDISDTVDAGYYLVMDYIEGDHLGALLASAFKHGDPLPPRVVMRIVSDALAGLGAAHELTDEKGKCLNLVHRDVSPHNIMVGLDGVSRLTDFGVAKAEDRLTHTREGQVKGKLAYMAPEQASQGTADPRSDLFSMGIILWESLTGQRLFRAETTAATLHKLLHAPIPAPSSVRPELQPLDALFDKALAREMGARYQSADEFIEAIEEAATGFGGLASLRKVGKAVKFHAAEKLNRDKRMIAEAIRALGISDKDGHPSLAPYMDIAETTSPSQASMGSGSGSSSSLSAVSGSRHSAMTMPSRKTGRVVPPPPPRSGAKAPSAFGEEASSLSNSALNIPVGLSPEVADEAAAPVGRKRKALVATGVLALAAVSAWAWLGSRQDSVRVTTMTLDDAPIAAEAPAAVATPTPPAAPPTEAIPVAPANATEATPKVSAPAISEAPKPALVERPASIGNKRPRGAVEKAPTAIERPVERPTEEVTPRPAPTPTPAPAPSRDFPALNPYR